MFKQAMDDGVLRQADPVQTVEAFLQLRSGWLARRIIWSTAEAPTKAQIAAKAKAAVAVFLDGYARMPSCSLRKAGGKPITQQVAITRSLLTTRPERPATRRAWRLMQRSVKLLAFSKR